MKKTVFFTIALFVGLGAYAQQTHQLNWAMGVQADLTIDKGDTVEWTMSDGVQHTVTSDAGSTESFNSGTKNPGETFSFTFTVVGTNPYGCNFHTNMSGTITVLALSIDERSIREFSIVPNPATSEIAIELPSQIENGRASIYNILGEMLYSQPLNSLNTTINIAAWSDGVYLIKIGNGNVSTTKRFIKK
ncbi:MAG TPA: T9SS type A sorting domain-containing protein [Flavobacteriaceae bacterium]|nr:T9SS type A sorting domain-containing protein [Flavobacteriaceae bacterium]